MFRYRTTHRTLPPLAVASAATAVGALLVTGATVWGSGLRAHGPFIPVLSPSLPGIVQRFYEETAYRKPAAVAAQELRAMDVLAEHTLTFHAEGNELANVMLAVGNIDGVTVQPGEVFSYNVVVGERTEERGFRPGLMYAGGRLITGIGGGVCIPSTALYIATLNAGLEIVERYHHSGPVSYAEPGLDAAVAFGYKDFRFRNTEPGPVVIQAKVEGDALTVTLRGRKRPGRRVVVETAGFQRLGFAEEQVVDPAIQEGEPEIEQEGRTGYTVAVYRSVYEDGKLVRRETVSRDAVAPLARILRVNPLDSEDAPETPEETPGSEALPAGPSPVEAAPGLPAAGLSATGQPSAGPAGATGSPKASIPAGTKKAAPAPARNGRLPAAEPAVTPAPAMDPAPQKVETRAAPEKTPARSIPLSVEPAGALHPVPASNAPEPGGPPAASQPGAPSSGAQPPAGS